MTTDETDHALLRETQQQLDNLTTKLATLGDRIAEIAEESRAEDRRLGERIAETDKLLGDHIETMISAIGGYIRDHPPA